MAAPPYTDGNYAVIEQVDGKQPLYPFLNGPTPDRYSKATERTYQVTPAAYVPQSPTRNAFTNLLTYSEQFDNSAWTKTALTIGANATTAPDGNLTMDSATETSATSAHSVAQAVTAAASPTTFSVFATANGRNFIAVQFTDSAATVWRGWFDLTLGRFFTSAGSNLTTGTITPLDNNSFRCAITFTPAAGSGTAAILLSSDGSTLSYAGNTADGVFLWGANFCTASTAGPYISTVGATRAVSSPVLDVDDPLQYLCEESPPKLIEANLMETTRYFARVPLPFVEYGNDGFARPVMDNIFYANGTGYGAGAVYAVTLDRGVSSSLFAVANLAGISSVGPITLATQTTTNNAANGAVFLAGDDITISFNAGGSISLDCSDPSTSLTTLNTKFGANSSAVTGSGRSFIATIFAYGIGFKSIVASNNTMNVSTTGLDSTGSAPTTITVTKGGTPVAAATTIISPATNQSYRTITLSSGSPAAGTLIAFFLGGRVVARTYVMLGSSGSVLRIPVADTSGNDFNCDRAAWGGARYLNGLKYCATMKTTTFYLPGVSSGINTPADIPQPDVIMSAQGWLNAIVAANGANGSSGVSNTTYDALKIGDLAPWKGPIYGQQEIDLMVLDALEQIPG